MIRHGISTAETFPFIRNSQRGIDLKIELNWIVDLIELIINTEKNWNKKKRGSSVIVCPPSAKGTQTSTEVDFHSDGPKCLRWSQMQKLARHHISVGSCDFASGMQHAPPVVVVRTRRRKIPFFKFRPDDTSSRRIGRPPLPHPLLVSPVTTLSPNNRNFCRCQLRSFRQIFLFVVFFLFV